MFYIDKEYKESKRQLELVEEYKKYEYEKYKHIQKSLERVKDRANKEYGKEGTDWSLQ